MVYFNQALFLSFSVWSMRMEKDIFFETTHHIPLYVEIYPTEICNLNCVFCPRENKIKEGFLSLETFQMIINKYKELKDNLDNDHIIKGTNFPMFIFAGGGEPLLNKNIFDYIKIVNDAGFLSWLTTNGTCLTDENITNLAHSSLTRLEVTVLGITEEEYHRSSGRKGFSKVYDSILKLNRALFNSNKNIDFQVTSYALDTIKSSDEEIVSFWQSAGVNFLGPLPVVNRAGKYKKFNKNKRTSKFGFSEKANFDEAVWCHYLKFFDTLTGKGNYIPCSAEYFNKNTKVLGNIKTDELSNVYGKLEDILQAKHLNQSCLGCAIMHSDWPVKYFLQKINESKSNDAVLKSLDR